jgi:oxygen-independent coproporphyrinogen-3 oxidase
LFAVKAPDFLPHNDSLEQMYLQGNVLLEDKGYKQYEVSAYAKDNHRCQHNVNYWQFGDYLGIGAGAHSKISFGSTNGVKRYLKYKLPKQYMNCETSFRHETRLLTEDDLMFEYMLNTVRLKQAFNLTGFSLVTGLNPKTLKEKLTIAIDMKWIEFQQDTFKLTEKGFLMSDEIVKLVL